MTLPLNWANSSLLILSQGGSECNNRVKSMFFSKERKRCIEESVFFPLGVMTSSLTFALTLLAQVLMCLCTSTMLFLSLIRERSEEGCMLGGASRWKVCLHLYLGLEYPYQSSLIIQGAPKKYIYT